MNKALNDIVRRADAWPDAAQEELAALAREIEAEVNAGAYHATPEELAGIDRGFKDSAEGRFATDKQVEAVLAKHRPQTRRPTSPLRGGESHMGMCSGRLPYSSPLPLRERDRVRGTGKAVPTPLTRTAARSTLSRKGRGFGAVPYAIALPLRGGRNRVSDFGRG